MSGAAVPARVLSAADKRSMVDLVVAVNESINPKALEAIVELLCLGVKARDLVAIFRSLLKPGSAAAQAAA